MNKLEAKEILIEAFLRNVRLYEANELTGFQEGFDEFLANYPKSNAQLRVLAEFWEAWADEASHGYPGFYEPLKKKDWPELASSILERLRKNEPVDDSRIKNLFPPGKIKFHPIRFVVAVVILFLLLSIFMPLVSPPLLVAISIVLVLIFQLCNVGVYQCKRKVK